MAECMMRRWEKRQVLLCEREFGYSVTRWLDYLFNIWPFSKMRICPITLKIRQSKLKILPKTK